MRRLFIALTLAFYCHAAHASAPSPADDIMNDPEFQQQMQQMRQTIMSDPQKAQEMMQAMQSMNQCIETKLGKEGLSKIGQQGKEIDTEMRGMCGAGKRDEAEKLKKDYTAKMLDSPELKGMEACSKEHASKLPIPDMAKMQKRMMEKYQNLHICDYYASQAKHP